MMPVNISEKKQDISTQIARVVFSMFVHVADREEDITAQDVRRFQALLKETAWIESEYLRSAVLKLQKDYSSFWTNYADGVLIVNTDSIAGELDRACRRLGQDRSRKLRKDLTRFLERMNRNAYGTALLLGDQRSRLNARKELLAELTVERKSSGKIDRKADYRPATKPVPASKSAATMWPAAAISPSDGQVWRGGKMNVRCVSVVLETHDTKTYSFVAEPRMLFNFKPGQFITLEIPTQGIALRRSYTISSSPTRPYTLSITVKKVPMGWMSNWLFDNMAEGFKCTINGPAGRFSCLDHPAEKLLFLTAGSGITPAMSMLRWLADTASDADIVFIDNVRTPDDIIFRKELLHLSAQLGERMRLAIVPAALAPGGPWHGPLGNFSEQLLRAYAPDFAEREIFVCGPTGYMAAVKSLLSSVGYPMEHYHDESFAARPGTAPSASSMALISPPLTTASTPRATPVATATASPIAQKPPTLATPTHPKTTPTVAQRSGIQISIQNSGEQFKALPQQTILEAAEASGVMLEHSCRSGICGACKMRKISGQVEMDEQTLLSEGDIETGYVLTCICRPTEDVILC